MIGGGVFKAAILSVLALLTLFMCGLILSLLAYTDLKTVSATLLSDEVLFAIRLVPGWWKTFSSSSTNWPLPEAD